MPTDVEARYGCAGGGWRYLLTRRVVQRAASGEALAFLGARRHRPSLAEWIEHCIHPSDRSRLKRMARGHLSRGEGPFEAELRALRRDGGNRWIVLRADVDRPSNDRRRCSASPSMSPSITRRWRHCARPATVLR